MSDLYPIVKVDCQVMDRVFGESEHAEKAKSRLAEYVVLDALIGNTDRHHENWGILRESPELFRPVLTKLKKLDEGSVDALVNRVPSDWMSPSARKFAIALMHYNFEQLQELLR